jgi:hypothetical protein
MRGFLRPIPTNHKASLVRQFGTLSPTFAEAGLFVNEDDLIRIMRAAKQDPLDLCSASKTAELLGKKLSGSKTFHEKIFACGSLIQGFFLFDGDPTDRSTEIDSIEKLIKISDDEAYFRARKWCRLSLKSGYKAFHLLTPGRSDEQRDAANKLITDFVKHTAQGASIELVTCLYTVQVAPMLKDEMVDTL